MNQTVQFYILQIKVSLLAAITKQQGNERRPLVAVREKVFVKVGWLVAIKL